MKAQSLTRRSSYRRKTHYVDERLQKLFLLGLVLLEISLALGLTWLMWRHLNQIIDDNLYRVHLTITVPILSQLMQESLYLLGIFFAVNLLALLVVDQIWRHYVNSILHAFIALMDKTAALDFSADPKISKRHQILDNAETQRAQDRKRFHKIRSRLVDYRQASNSSDNTSASADLLYDLHQLLPHHQTYPAPSRSPNPPHTETDSKQ